MTATTPASPAADGRARTPTASTSGASPVPVPAAKAGTPPPGPKLPSTRVTLPKGPELNPFLDRKLRDKDGIGIGSTSTQFVMKPVPEVEQENLPPLPAPATALTTAPIPKASESMMSIDNEQDPDMPDLVDENENIQPTASGSGWASQHRETSVAGWNQNGRWPYEQLSNNASSNWAGAENYDWSGYSQGQDVLVRDWWDPEERAKHPRPGPGLLPLAAYERLHNDDHTLLKVRITTPGDEDVADSKIGTSVPFQDGLVIPSDTEVQSAIPHPAAAYCPSENGWTILEIRANKALPKLNRLPAGAVLPDEDRRQRSSTCKAPETHHFHQYNGAADGSVLDVPYSPAAWAVKQSDLMNVLVCCRCTTYAVSSAQTIPGVIPVAILDAYIKERSDYPQTGKTPQDMVAWSLWSVLRIMENYLWKGQHQALKSTSKFFALRVGWNEQSKQLWSVLGFTYKLRPTTPEMAEHELVIPPEPTPEVRARLLRAWVELHAWLANYRRKTNPLRFAVMKDAENQYREFVRVEVQTETTQMLLGCGPGEMKRERPPLSTETVMLKGLGLTEATWDLDLIKHAYQCQIYCDPAHTPQHFTRITRLNIMVTNWSSLDELIVTQKSLDRWTQEDLHVAARRLGYGEGGVIGVELGGLEDFWREDAIVASDSDDFIETAYKHARDAANGPPTITITGFDSLGLSTGNRVTGAADQMKLKDALRIVGEFMGSKRLVGLSKAKDPMSLDRAYHVLEVPADMDEDTLLMVHSLRVEDSPAQAETMNEAISVIAEARGSERLKRFITSGIDPGDLSRNRPPEWPRGLNQLGNTCYLNSLLQYFYTIKDLREAVTVVPEATIEADKDLDIQKVTDDDLKKHRVGGRLVTRREIARSRKFVTQLANLFTDLRLRDDLAVTPSLELAKLALVTSKDEEEDDARTTNSTASTDKTLVDDAPVVSVPPTAGAATDGSAITASLSTSSSGSAASSSSVLGKRLRRSQSAMDLDSQSQSQVETTEKDGFVVVGRNKDEKSDATQLTAEPTQLPAQPMDTTDDAIPSVTTAAQDKGKLVPPPLPPRKKSTIEDSGMMFGRQHDVSECMDNCMFQIETALLRFDDGSEDVQKGSVVKRLFYGKLRQRITALDGTGKPNEKEDLYMSLPVNVVDEDTTDLYDGLAGYFDDIVDFEGKKSRMEVTLVDLPPVLHIQLQRVQFNRETLQPYKCHAYVKFGETIHMDRFLDSAPTVARERSKAIHAELATCRERLRTLTQGKFTPYANSLKHTLDFLRNRNAAGELVDSEVDDSLVSILMSEQNALDAEISELRARLKTLAQEREALWQGHASPEAEYELTSVFVHRGAGPTFGHYFFYARNLPESPNDWFKYNDSEVSGVARDEVLRDSTGDTLNAYMLVYARKGADVMHTIHREVPRSDQDMAVESFLHG